MAYYSCKRYKLNCPPLELFDRFEGLAKRFFLDSSLKGSALGRYSFLGFKPFETVSGSRENVFRKLRNKLNEYKLCPQGMPPFAGGALGYVAYPESGAKKSPNVPEALFAFYNTVIQVDHLKNELKVFAAGFPEKNTRLQKALCEENIGQAEKLIFAALKPQVKTEKPCLRKLRSDLTKAGYIATVRKAKKYIKAGDIYQVNLTQMFEAECSLAGSQIYRRLRLMSPSYFGSYFDTGSFELISSSPECFLRLDGRRVYTRPMKGTRPRSGNKAEDNNFKQELIKSAKDKAELIMIVDLERNDLGRVCGYDSIKVDSLRNIEEYNTVFQTTAEVSGLLFQDKDRIDLLEACSPGGSITGCPKIRAMEIIGKLEPVERSVYTGSFGYLGFAGDLQMSILIRTILKKGKKIYFGAGGGIVADSSPLREYNESLVKVRGILKALEA